MFLSISSFQQQYDGDEDPTHWKKTCIRFFGIVYVNNFKFFGLFLPAIDSFWFGKN
jgi:hypothetical protein